MVKVGAALVLGVMSWSLAEYVIHRWLGHHRRLVRNPFGAEHIAHHGKGDYFAATWKKLATAAVVSGLLLGPAIWLAGVEVGAAYVVGFVGFYGFYEVLHRLEHVWSGVGPYGRWARRHHFYHHFHDPSLNHGVTSPLWDWVFGTYAAPGVIRVPKKLQMKWLVNSGTGEVWPRFAGDYELRKRRDAA